MNKKLDYENDEINKNEILPELLTLKEAAQYLKVTKSTLWRYIHDGKGKKKPLETLKINGTSTRISKQQILDFIHQK